MGNKYKMVSALKGKHADASIWIAGSDPSLSTYPDNFFDDKVGITLHLAHSKFPNATYRYASEYDRVEYYLEKDLEYKTKPFIGAYPMYGYSKKATVELIHNLNDAYLHQMVSYPPHGIRGDVNSEFTRWKLRKTMNGAARIWGSHGTCLHTAYYVAVLMGASEINLIGCGHGTYQSGLEHFDAVSATDKSMRPNYPSFSDPKNIVPVIEQTLALIEGSRSLGIKVNWYRSFSDSMTDMVAIDPTWLADMKSRIHDNSSLVRKIYRQLYKRPINTLISKF